MGVCIGEKSVFKTKNGQETKLTNKCDIAWRID